MQNNATGNSGQAPLEELGPARGETAIGVLARALDAELVVADIGLAGERLPMLRDRRVAAGSADITTGPALSPQQLRSAIEAGHALASDLAKRCEIIVVGEIGIGNTTAAAALLAALTSLPPDAVCGRGTGLDAQGLQHKQNMVAAALAANTPDRADPLECLRRLGGLPGHPDLLTTPEVVTQVDRRADDDQVALVAQHRRHERAVDLQLIDRHPAQIGQRRVSRAEIIDRQPHAESAELADGG